MPSQLDPIPGKTTCFLFTRCQARLDGQDLLVTVTGSVSARGARCTPSGDFAWDTPTPLTGDLTIACGGSSRLRHDRAEYPRQPAYAGNVISFRFSGGVSYGRVPHGSGWALHVEGVLTNLSGAPPGVDLAGCDSVVISAVVPAAAPQAASLMSVPQPAPQDGGPHMPFP